VVDLKMDCPRLSALSMTPFVPMFLGGDLGRVPGAKTAKETEKGRTTNGREKNHEWTRMNAN
jgi:hypothetical protein